MASLLRERAEAARAFLVGRGDVALGLAPQALLPGRAADAWACLWAAARRVDDAVDAGRVDPPADWRRAVAGPAAADLDAFMGSVGPGVRRALEERFEVAWRGVRARHGWRRPPALAGYVEASMRSAGLPMRAYFRLAGVERAEAAADLLGLSVQLGDDARDAEADAARGLCTWIREELEAAGLEPGVPPSGTPDALLAVRHRLVASSLAASLARLPVPDDGEVARAALGPYVLWHHALRSDQVRPTRRPLRLPGLPREADGLAALRGGLDAALAPVVEAPREVASILHQELLRRARGLPAWAEAVLEAAAEA